MHVNSIAVVGGLNMDMIFSVDRVPNVGESKDALSLTQCPGGKGANTAVAAYRASHFKPQSLQGNSKNGSGSSSANGKSMGEIQVYMNGAVGNDAFGPQLKKQLEINGVDISAVQTLDDDVSGTCCVFVDKGTGESRNLAYQGANLKWTPSQPDSVTCFGGDKMPDLIVLHLGISAQVVESVLATASKKGVATLLNPSPAVPLNNSTYKNLTHLVLNESEAALLSGEKLESFNGPAAWQKAGKYFISLGVRNVVITLGAKGAFYATYDDTMGYVEAEKNIEVLDATGAGDTFVGTYAVGYIKGKQEGKWNIQRAVKRACRASAVTIQQFGAQESIPWADEIDK